MGKLFLFTVLATFFAFAASVNVRAVDGVQVHSAVDDEKLKTFTKIGEKYYAIGTQELTWFGAAHACRRLDAHLATVETEEEWQALNNYLLSKGFVKERFWFSGNNLDSLKEYYWLSNGQQMKYTKWISGQPDNLGGNEHCAQLWRAQSDFGMNDAPCNWGYLYICEAPSPKTVSITIW